MLNKLFVASVKSYVPAAPSDVIGLNVLPFKYAVARTTARNLLETTSSLVGMYIIVSVAAVV